MKTEMRLVKFLLHRSGSVELLVLVVAPKCGLQMWEIERTRKSYHLKYHSNTEAPVPSSPTIITKILDRLLTMPKAAKDARIVLCDDGEFESRNLSATHAIYEYEPPRDRM
ncbi:hypothetical protein Sjap_023387 [Stephania japonica]|uniref:Uncharacterized protein n=1 Tax=Stephania japonica TaxID=461633 RepID=A0AAP0HP71_9MAGN